MNFRRLPIARRRGIALLPLEARVMFDAAAAVDATAPDTTPDPAHEAAPAPVAPAAERAPATPPAAIAPVAGSDSRLGDAARRVWSDSLARANELLAGLTQRTDFAELLRQSFGSAGTDAGTLARNVDALGAALRDGRLNLTVELRGSAELQGAWAAYAARGADGSERLYVNADWLQSGASVADVTRALLEEAGHAIDQRVNDGADAAGDEGERFAVLATGGTLNATEAAALDADADVTELTLDGVAVEVEFAQLSVPFTDGFIGTRGSNSNQVNDLLTFQTLGIRRASFFQESTTGNFTAQGNDIPGGVRLTLYSGQVITINGAINWRLTSGSTLHAFGFIPDPATVPVSFAYSGGLFTLDATSNFALERVSSTYVAFDHDDVSGNAATSGLLTDLNDYLALVRANDPNGPVTVNPLTTSSTTPTLTGTAVLAANESLAITVAGRSYTTGSGLVVGGGVWSLTIPGASPLTVGTTYSVDATITNNTTGYALTDSTSSELVVVAPDATAPVIASGQTFSYAENRSAGVALGTVGATDAVGVTGFRFSNGTTTSSDGFFAIDSAGRISLTTAGAAAGAASNDYETGANSFTHAVQARDAAGNWSASTNVTLNVTDLDDTAPVVGAGQSFNYQENRSVGTVLGTVTASDAVGVTGFRFSNGTTTSTDGFFTIDATGRITLTTVGAAAAAASNDFEQTPNAFTLDVQARDAAGNWSAATSVTLNVTDVDDTAPAVGAGQSFAYEENRSAGTVLGTVTATDAVGVTGFRFANGTATSTDGFFAIDATGRITLTTAGAAASAASNDFEQTPNAFTHAVQARDAVGNWSAATNVTLNVTDLDDTAPVVGAGQSFAYQEDRSAGTVLGTVTASDAVGVTAFRFANGTATSTDGFFAIDSAGRITLTTAGAAAGAASNDFEQTPNAFTLDVQARDAVGNWSAATSVALNVTDLDDTAPTVGAGQSFNYEENRNAGTVLGTVTATDAVGVAGFRFSNGTATSSDGFFAIDSAGRITLTTAGAAASAASNDFEQTPNAFTHAVQARDAAGNWSAATNVTLNVTDLDDTAPVVGAGQSFNYQENRGVGTTLGTVGATDAVGVTGFRFANGTTTSTDGFFAIDAAGRITLTTAGAAAAAASNDFEQAPNAFTLDVQARDAAGSWSAPTSVTLNVTDLDDTAPTVGAGQSFVYEENRTAGTTLGTVGASDAVGITGFRFANGTTTSPDGFFAIDAAGRISLTTAGAAAGAASNDFETGANTFTHAVQARDAAGNWSAATNVTLHVADVDETPPARDDAAIGAEDEPLVGNVLANDAAPGARVAGFGVGGRWAGAGETLTLDGIGRLTIAADGAYRFEPAADWHGTVPAASYRTEGGAGATLTLVVAARNDAPALPGSALETFQDTPRGGPLPPVVDADGDTATLSLGTAPAHGSVALSADGRYVYTPRPGFHGSDRFEIVADDGHGGRASAWVEVQVTPAPTIALATGSDLGVSDRDRVTSADRVVLEGGGAPGATLAIAAPDGTPVGRVVVGADGRWALAGVDLTRLVGDAARPAGAPGVYTFQVRQVASDGRVGPAAALAVVRELPPLPPPAAEPPSPPPPPAPLPAPEPVREPLAPAPATGFDSVLRPPVELRAEASPAGPTGVAPVVAEAPRADAAAASRTGSPDDIYTRPSGFAIMVTPSPEPSLQVFRGLDDQVVRLGAEVNLQIAADTFVHTKVDETITLQATLADGRPLPPWLSFDGKAGTLTGEVPEGWRQDLAIRVVARDSQGREAAATMRLKLVDDNAGARGAGLSRQLMNIGGGRSLDAGAKLAAVRAQPGG